MKKIMLIILGATVITFLIFMYVKQDKYNITILGDSGNMAKLNHDLFGISYNDYLAEEIIDKYQSSSYNMDYIYHQQKVKDLIDDIKDNKIVNKKTIKKVIHDSNKVILFIGIDEILLAKHDQILDYRFIEKFLSDYSMLLSELKLLTDHVIIINIPKLSKVNLKYQNNINDYIHGLTIKYQYEMVDVSDLSYDNNYYFNQALFQKLSNIIF